MAADARPFSKQDRVYAVKTWHDGATWKTKGTITDIMSVGEGYYVLPDSGTIGDWYKASDLTPVGDDAACARVRAECQGLQNWQLIEMIAGLRAENEAYREAARAMLSNWRFGNFYKPQQPEPLYVRKFAELHRVGTDRLVALEAKAEEHPA